MRNFKTIRYIIIYRSWPSRNNQECVGQTSRGLYDLCVRDNDWIAARKSYFFWHPIGAITPSSGLQISAWKSYFAKPSMLHIHFRDDGSVFVKWVESPTCSELSISCSALHVHVHLNGPNIIFRYCIIHQLVLNTTEACLLRYTKSSVHVIAIVLSVIRFVIEEIRTVDRLSLSYNFTLQWIQIWH